MTNTIQLPALWRNKDSEADIVPGLERMIKDLETPVTEAHSGLINCGLRGEELKRTRHESR
ncbi:hypothetical protein IB277_20050 [Ensifer sp. ENS07]|uniref:hypothetical protein n=1 Tax=Ensifer sp. ENS07 TaxID=2769274 RepID=UPI00177E7F60|nr:hypothetical protein [Ensifer sp. ENS07]MBD9638601.1 hypothetical protein [Ensifer sp. ENS07]